ncbi:MAG: Asp-tRNA(Asn)/Glu-tRNA(Gln) amidotransferase subunit GatB [Proteobacteria bacterium]|nr:Asp-tRNA(Asn)/Glu-tRNA(Gln) amidotransferase subunit GatB [Pseudomonadota bacterium]
MAFDTVIGLEVHVQLKTKTKLFSGSSIQFGAKPNTQTSFIDAGLPGVLPVLNAEAVKMAIQFGLAIDAQIANNSYFERKNYFYPDLPKGYQISQFQKPIVADGHLDITLEDGSVKKITIERAHLEEDAGKSIHENEGYSGIDLNRAGTPLLEIVTTPCLNSSEEALSYLKTLYTLVRFLGICDGNMQEGSFRCDINISLKPKGSDKLGTRVELKNLNSFRFIEKAIFYEQRRQTDLIETNQMVIQETRLYDANSDTTRSMRTKENENDYRYFPDPDLLPIAISSEEIDKIKLNLPLLPQDIKANLNKNPALIEEDILFLLSSPATYSFFESIKKESIAEEKLIINWLKNNYLASLNENNLSFDTPPISAEKLSPLLDKLQEKKISSKFAKDIFSKLWQGSNLSIDDIMKEEGLDEPANNEELEQIVKNIIAKHPEQASDYRAGKEKLLAFFVGQAMKETKGKANAALLNELFKAHL